jgi:hypothetical protein
MQYVILRTQVRKPQGPRSAPSAFRFRAQSAHRARRPRPPLCLACVPCAPSACAPRVQAQVLQLALKQAPVALSSERTAHWGMWSQPSPSPRCWCAYSGHLYLGRKKLRRSLIEKPLPLCLFLLGSTGWPALANGFHARGAQRYAACRGLRARGAFAKAQYGFHFDRYTTWSIC